VRYDQAVLCETGDALDALERSIHKKLDPLSPDLLKKVRQGALDSPQTSLKIKNLLTEKKKPK
jgi:hypothetical protein